MKDQDVESQTGGSVVRFIPAVPDAQARRRSTGWVGIKVLITTVSQ